MTLFDRLFLFQGYQQLFRDSDAGWHIRAGEEILSTLRLPRTDPYSFTQSGKPWFAWEWGADVVAGAVHRQAGLGGVAWLYALGIAAAVWAWFRLHWLLKGDFLLACLMAPLLLTTSGIHWLARPHVWSWSLSVGALWFLERFAGRDFRARRFAVVALASALWANIHGSFLFAPCLALLYAACCWLSPLIWTLDSSAERRKARWCMLAGCVSAAATLANPYGWNLHRHVVAYLADSALLARIGEFQSFNFHVAGAGQIVLAVGLSMAGGVVALGLGRLPHFLVATVMVAGALGSARLLPLVAFLALPLANAAFSAGLRRARGLTPRLRARLDAWLDYSAGLRDIDARGGGLALAPLVALACFALLRAPGFAAQTGFPPHEFPVAAYAEVERLPPDARLFAPDKFGGYLIYRSAGRRKVFFDGRSDLYGAEFLARYGRLVQVRPGWRQYWDTWNFTHALLPNDYSLIPALEQAGWKQVHRDGTATLLEARN